MKTRFQLYLKRYRECVFPCWNLILWRPHSSSFWLYFKITSLFSYFLISFSVLNIAFWLPASNPYGAGDGTQGLTSALSPSHTPSLTSCTRLRFLTSPPYPQDKHFLSSQYGYGIMNQHSRVYYCGYKPAQLRPIHFCDNFPPGISLCLVFSVCLKVIRTPSGTNLHSSGGLGEVTVLLCHEGGDPEPQLERLSNNSPKVSALPPVEASPSYKVLRLSGDLQRSGLLWAGSPPRVLGFNLIHAINQVSLICFPNLGWRILSVVISSAILFVLWVCSFLIL